MTIVALLFIGFFPYCLMLDGLLMRVGVIELPLTYNSSLELVIPAVALILASLGTVYLLKKGNRAKFAQYARLLNIVQIPAHLFNIVICIGLALTLFGIILVPVFIGVSALAFMLNRQLREKGEFNG